MPILRKKIQEEESSGITVTDFFRYPHTPHITWLSKESPRDDKVLSPAESKKLLAGPVLVEEKLDGANLGFSIGPNGQVRAQNRGQYLVEPFSGQYSRLNDWLHVHRTSLLSALTDSQILFGEWCAARHSLNYEYLPDWWIMFDVYDRSTGRFWSTTRRNLLGEELGLQIVPSIFEGKTDIKGLVQLTLEMDSQFRNGPLEGLVVRRDSDAWLENRAKLVNPNFSQDIKHHWKSRRIEWNRLALNPLDN